MEKDYTVIFHLGEKRGTTVAVLTSNESGVTYRGIAHCNPSDTYNQEVGARIAEARARKKFFKAEANEAKLQVEIAKRLLAVAERTAQKKVNRFERESNWLDKYVKTI